AHRTGVGAVRPLVLEYPDDPNTWGEAARYEFLSGDAFLVAPVYQPTTVRDGIYLPAGRWIDYWSGLHRPADPQRLPRPAGADPAVRQGRIDRPDVAGGDAVVADQGP